MMKKLIIIFIVQLFGFEGFSQVSHSLLITDSLQSNVLNEKRNICIYLPESFDNQKKYPVVYCTDGQKVIEDDYKKELDSLISLRLIEPIVLIGIYSNEKELGTSTTYRQLEYVKYFSKDSASKQRFEDHLQFFLKEAPEYAFKKYNIKEDTNKSTFYGYSNGAGYGMTLFFEGDHLYSNFICFSPLGNINTPKKKNKIYPTLYVSYGVNELFLLVDDYKELIAQLKKQKYIFHVKPYNGGHMAKDWKREFCRTLTKIYPLIKQP